MNFCTKCKSYYEKPGTCNCFAEKQQEGTQWVGPVPTWEVPWWIYNPPAPVGPWNPNTWETTCGDTSAGITLYPNTSSATYANVDVTYT